MFRFVVAAVVLVIALVRAEGAEAKSFAYVVSGGELGPYAHHFFLAPGDEGKLAEEGLIVAPKPLPSLAYDLYNSWGNFAVAFQVSDGGPELRYYPEARLLSRRWDGVWMRVPDEGAAILDAAIAEALAKKAEGELEVGPIAADFRARHLPEFTYHINDYSAAVHDLSTLGELWQSGESKGRIHGSADEAFIMRHLVQTVSGARRFSAGAVPSMGIYYSGQVGHTGYGGVLGFYSPPEEGRPGRFWLEDGNFYGDSAAYYETTLGFDAAIAGAIERSGEEEAPPPGGSPDIGNIVAAGFAGTLLAAGLLIVGRRRQTPR